MRRRGDPPARHAQEAQRHACAQGAGLASSPSPVGAAHADALCRPARVFTPRPGQQSRTRKTARANTGVAPSLPTPRVVLQAVLSITQGLLRPPRRRRRPVWVGACEDLSWQPRSYGSPLALGVTERTLSGFQELPVGLCGRGSRWLSPLRVCPDRGPGDSQA